MRTVFIKANPARKQSDGSTAPTVSMNSSTTSNVISIVSAAVSAALAIAWGVDLAAGPFGIAVRGALLVGAAATCGATAALLAGRVARSQSIVRQHIELLTRSEVDEATVGALPSLPPDHPCRAELNRLISAVLSTKGRLAASEQLLAKTQVRQRQLASQRRQMDEVLAGLPNPVLAIDQYDELVLANPSAEDLFHLKTENTRRRELGSLIACEELVDLLTETRRRKTRSTRNSDINLVDSTGREQTYRATVRGFGTGEEPGAPTEPGAVAVLQNVTAQKETHRRNAEFVSAVSHEMKTPLAGIKAYVELLADGDAEDAETREEFLEVINGQADRLQRLIENMLNLARIEAGVVNVEKRAVALNEILEEAVHLTAPAAEQRNVALESDLSQLHLETLADRDMILQSAINLLSNAIKYTPPGGTVTMRSRPGDGQIAFEVIDTGVGLSEEDRERVFDKFYRVKKDQQMAPGTGLGLPLAKHIVEDVHGGSLDVESKLGHGSTFRITLPTTQAVQ